MVYQSLSDGPTRRTIIFWRGTIDGRAPCAHAPDTSACGGGPWSMLSHSLARAIDERARQDRTGDRISSCDRNERYYYRVGRRVRRPRLWYIDIINRYIIIAISPRALVRYRSSREVNVGGGGGGSGAWAFVGRGVWLGRGTREKIATKTNN